jgi:hypothetical protein
MKGGVLREGHPVNPGFVFQTMVWEGGGAMKEREGGRGCEVSPNTTSPPLFICSPAPVQHFVILV